MKWIALLLFCLGIGMAIIGIAGHRFTGAKLEKMEMIRGMKPGAIHREVEVTDKIRIETPLEMPAYWIAWNNANIQVRSNERINLTEGHWNSIKIGERIPLVSIEGDPFLYHPDGIFASDGNMAFDEALQLIEIGIAGIGVILALSAIPVFIIGSRRSEGSKATMVSNVPPRVD